MEYNKDKVDEIALAMLYLTSFKSNDSIRAWKSIEWETMQRLYNKGYIGNPKSKSKSVILTNEGAKQSEEMFKKYCL
jgi:uncharacterized protein YvpB